METASATGEGARRSRPGALIAWSVLALLQVVTGVIAFATRGDVDDSNPLFESSFVVTSIVVYSILILLTFGIAAGYSLDSRRALGFRRFEPRWLAAVVGVILASLVIGAVTSLFGDAAEEQGLAPDRWEPGRRVSSRRQPSSSSSSSRSPKSSSSAASGSACSRSPGRSSRSQSLQSPSRSRTAYRLRAADSARTRRRPSLDPLPHGERLAVLSRSRDVERAGARAGRGDLILT